MAYLGFHKEGAKFSLATSAHTKGSQTKFSYFSYGEKNNLLPKGAMANGPPIYATENMTTTTIYTEMTLVGGPGTVV